MSFRNALSRFHQTWQRGRQPRRLAPVRIPLALEYLEDRVVPSIFFEPRPQTVSYGGGPILPNAHLELVFWGANWNQAAYQPLRNSVADAVTSIVSGPYLDALAQYGGIGHANLPAGHTLTIATSSPNPVFTIPDVVLMLRTYIAGGILPDPATDPQLLYLVIPQPGSRIATFGGELGGFHSFDLSPLDGFTPYHFGFTADPLYAGDPTLSKSLDFVSTVFSHELVEAVSDPEGTAFQIDPRSGANELCDGDAQYYTYRLGDYLVQAYWSTFNQAYVVPTGQAQNFIVTDALNRLLLVTGDQLALPNDVVTLTLTPAGGVRAILNGEAAEFDLFAFDPYGQAANPNIRGIAVTTLTGTNTVTIDASNTPINVDLRRGTGDTLNLGSPGVGLLDRIQGLVTYQATPGDPNLVFNDQANLNNDTYTISNAQVLRDRLGIFFNYTTSNSLTLNLGTGNNRVSIRSVPANTPVVVNGGAGYDQIEVPAGPVPFPQASWTNVRGLLVDGGNLILNQDLTIPDFIQTGGTLSGPRNLTMTGIGTWTGGTMTGTGATVVSGRATLSLSGGVKTLSGRTLSNNGTATWTSGDIVGGTGTVSNSGTLSGMGTLTDRLVNQGQLFPGGPGVVGSITVNGNYTQGATGVLNIEIAAANLFDRLLITGDATLGGTLNISLLNSFVPAQADTFVIMTYARRLPVGAPTDFATTNGTAIPGGNRFGKVFNADNLTLRVLAPIRYTNLADSGAGSLRQAITDAPFGDTIAPASGLNGTIHLMTPLDNAFKALTIVGQTDGSGSITLDGGGMHRLFNTRGNEDVSFSNLTFANGTANTTGSGGFGGAVQLDHNHRVTFTSCIFTNNTSTGGGGAIDAAGGSFGTLTLTNCAFTGNTTNGVGGAIRLEGFNAVISRTTFTNNGNSTTFSGGAIDASSSPGSVTITGGSFMGNQAGPSGRGGAINLVLYSASITGTTFTNNAAGSGGAVDASGLNPSALISLITVTFTTNMAIGTTAAFGGALEITNVSANITGCTFTGNTSGILGGGSNGRAGAADLFANQTGYGVTFNLIDTRFVNNMANGSGAIIISLQSGSSSDVYAANIQGCTFDGNTSTSTGDIVGFGGAGNFYAQGYSADLNGDNGSATITIGRSTNGPTEFKNNKSARFGGGFAATAYASYGASAAITLGDSDGATPSLLIHDNTSNATNNPLQGGGAYLQAKSQPNFDQTTTPFAKVVLQHADIFNNSTTALTSSNGGGLYIENDSLAPTGSAEVDVFSSTIHDNTTVGQGGGAFVGLQSLNTASGVRSKVVFTNDTIYQNSTTGDPTASQGGGLYISRVLSGNSAVEVDLNSLTVAKNTAAAQGGNLAVNNDSALTVNTGNSIYSNGVSGVAGISADVFGTVISMAGPGLVGGYNILEDNTDGNHGFTDPTDQVGVDPQLDLTTGLFMTGHSALKVLGFLPSSPALNSGDPVNMAFATDETDWIRPATPTVGAYDPNATSPMFLGGSPPGGSSSDPGRDSTVVQLLSSSKR